jgi:esterase/lipase superfamily enzyme
VQDIVMQQRQLLGFAVAFALALALGSGISIAQPTIDENTVLQICQAFSNKAPEQMPAIVSPEAGKKFIETYNSISGKLHGCLSAKQTVSDATGLTFLLQHTQYEANWHFSTDDKSINEIAIRLFRPVTLAGDGDWEIPPQRTSGSSVIDVGALAETVQQLQLKLALDQARLASSFSEVSSVLKNGAPAPPAPPNIVEFFYATNRKQSDAPATYVGNPPATSMINGNRVYSSDGWTAVGDYTGERETDLSFGAIRVSVPEGHHIGQIELPSEIEAFGYTLYSFSPNPTKHFIIRSIEKTDEAAWIKSLSSMTGKKALVFVHGFNTKFRDAVFRTAQIVWDLQYHGTTVLFSWPSRGEIADYLYDTNSALASRDALMHVIADLHNAGFTEINILAHSMGNLIAVDALSNSAATQSPVAIAQLVMAAPDVDRDMFIKDIPGLAKVAKGLTLYADANDKALQLSKRIAGNIPRAGDVPQSGPVVIPPVWTIDASVIGDEVFGLNHDVFATTRNILNDLKILLETGAPPPRLGEIHAYPAPPQKATYFRYVP